MDYRKLVKTARSSLALVVAMIISVTVLGCNTRVEEKERSSERRSIEADDFWETGWDPDPHVSYYELLKDGAVVGSESLAIEEMAYAGMWGPTISDVTTTVDGRSEKVRYVVTPTAPGAPVPFIKFKKTYERDGSTYDLKIHLDEDIGECLVIETEAAGTIQIAVDIVQSGFDTLTKECVVPSLGLEKRELNIRFSQAEWDYDDS